ncbi:MAG TPA: hypothetical protein VFT22_38685 [Kofleriaceae bacterium]|nr:hypothetical protein [Kofleriaceae bacterium]
MADLVPSSSRPGRLVFAAAIAGLAAQNLIYRDFLAGFQPAPSGLPLRAVLAVIAGAIGLAAAAGIASERHAVTGARLVLGLLAVNAVAFHVPVLIAHPARGGAWAVTCEVIALGGIAAMLALPASSAGRIVFAATLPAFGLFHFLYLDYIVSVIPRWIPGHTFWAIATGAALIAAGVSLLTGRRARLAAILTTVMFGSWVVLLHVPRMLERRHANEWTSLFIATAMCGGAWLIVAARRRG